MKKIISLTKIFIKEYYQSLPIFDKEKFNKKNLIFWGIVLIFLGIAYVSFEIIKFLIECHIEIVFLNTFFPFLFIILTFETIMTSANLFFFSTDIKKTMHMPIKPLELLIAKLITLLYILYITEIVVAIVPLVLYGILTISSIAYYPWLLVIMLVFPVFIAISISILIFILMKLGKLFRNKEIFQIIITIILMTFVFYIESMLLQSMFYTQNNEQVLEQLVIHNNKIQDINNKFFIINPSVKILLEPEKIESFLELGIIIAYNFIALLVFCIIGKISYIKYLLKNTETSEKKSNKKNVDIKKKVKNNSIRKTYIKKEMRLIYRTPAFLIQCVFPVIILLINLIIIVFYLIPIIEEIVLQNNEISIALEQITMNTEVICDILIVLQVLFSISNISLTAISREGKNAKFIKYIPVELYKQFKYKNFPQFVLNLLVTLVILGLVWYMVPIINIGYVLLLFIISTVINLINCYLMLIIDLQRPNLDWNSENAVVRKSDNKAFQYAFMIINTLVLLYIAKIFKGFNIILGLIIEFVFYLLVFIIIDRCVKKWQNKLFNKII